MKGQRIDVHIEELVLHGIGAGDHGAIAKAVEREVARTLASPPVGAAVARAVRNSLVTGRASRPGATGRTPPGTPTR